MAIHDPIRKSSFLVIFIILFSTGSIQGLTNGLEATNLENPSSTSIKNIVVQLDDEKIDIDYLQNYIAIRPKHMQSNISKAVEQRLDELITGEVLCQKAICFGLDRRPDIRLRIQQILAQSLLEEQVNKSVRQQQITALELETYYNDHIDEFQRPAQVRVSDIFISVNPSDTSNERTEKKNKIQKILSDLIAGQEGRMGFARQVINHSDTPEKYTKGNTGFFDIKGKPVGLDRNIARQAFELEKIGNICPQIIEASDGYHIIMLTGKRGPANTPLGKVKEQLRQRIYRERIEHARTEYIEGLKRKSNIKINQDVLEKFIARYTTGIAVFETENTDGFPSFSGDADVKSTKTRDPGRSKF